MRKIDRSGSNMKLEAKGIRRQFFRNGKNTNWFNAVETTDFTLEEGRITEILGRSGSGKTTLSHMLAGLLTPTEGTVLLEGQDLYAMSDGERSRLRNRHIGVIPQGQTGLKSLTVLEKVLAPVLMYEDPRESEAYARELLEKMEIAELGDVYANELSGGELRRMAVARALIRKPGILIADEPTGDLDNETTGLVLGLFRSLAEEGTAILMVTHDEEAFGYADRIYRMEKGVLKPEKYLIKKGL